MKMNDPKTLKMLDRSTICSVIRIVGNSMRIIGFRTKNNDYKDYPRMPQRDRFSAFEVHYAKNAVTVKSKNEPITMIT